MKLFNWIFAKNKKARDCSPDFVFEFSDVKAKRYDDFIHYMDRQAHWRIERGE